MNLDSAKIIACSSGFGVNCALSVIRLSGFSSILDFRKFFSKDVTSFQHQLVVRSSILDVQGKLLDDVLVTFFKGPTSYTGENVLEISCHGNPLIVEGIISLFKTALSFRDALPGEFTFRALKNKKINLLQAEGLGLILSSKNEYGLRQGFSLLNGELNKEFDFLYNAFLNHRSALEILIDFSEDVGEEDAKNNLLRTFDEFSKCLSKLYYRSMSSVNFSDLKVVLFGLPNAGKSSLFNALLAQDRSIVSEIKGTTRDYISEEILINGNRFSLVDTAGLRSSLDPVEAMGVIKSLNLVENAFFKILVINPLEDSIDELKNYCSNLKLRPNFLVFTHADCVSDSIKMSSYLSYFNDVEYVTASLKTGSIEPVLGKNSGSIEPGANLSNELFNQINKTYLSLVGDSPLPLERVRGEIKNIYEMSMKYSSTLNNFNDLAILSGELFTLQNCLSSLVGVGSPDDVLNNIFSNFCIGK